MRMVFKVDQNSDYFEPEFCYYTGYLYDAKCGWGQT
jgi:hypothetical protein